MIKRIVFFSFLIAIPAFAQPSAELHKVSVVAESADSTFALSSELILTAADSEKKLVLHKFENGSLTKSAEAPSLGHVWSATLFGSGASARIVLAYGLGRGDLNAPLRAVSYSTNLKDEKVIYTFTTDRSQMIHLEAQNERILVSFFNSKYETETGYLSPVTSSEFRYEKNYAVRMGTSLAARGDQLAIGRMYGDIQGQDGDLQLKNGSEPAVTLPSYRGVSSVAFLGEKILIGDGWHSNYGQMAQARLSLLSAVPNTKRYALEIVNIFTDAYAVNKIIPTSGPVLIVTNNHLVAATPGDEWKFKDLYKQQNSNSIFDVQYVAAKSGEVYVSIADGASTLFKFKS